MSIGKNIRALMAREGISTEMELAKRSGLTQSTVHRIISGRSKDPRNSNLERIARALRCDTETLRVGSTDVALASEAGVDLGHDSGNPGRSAAVLNWAEIAHYRSFMSAHGSNLERRLVPADTGENSFWSKVNSVSMTASTGDSFPPGTYVLIDPDRAPQAGNYVVAKVGEQPVLRLYVPEPPFPHLLALNDSFEPIPLTEDVEIIGVVITSARDHI